MNPYNPGSYSREWMQGNEYRIREEDYRSKELVPGPQALQAAWHLYNAPGLISRSNIFRLIGRDSLKDSGSFLATLTHHFPVYEEDEGYEVMVGWNHELSPLWKGWDEYVRQRNASGDGPEL